MVKRLSLSLSLSLRVVQNAVSLGQSRAARLSPTVADHCVCVFLVSPGQNYAQKLVNADRASIFLLDRKARELYARIFDVGSGSGPVPSESQRKEIRFELCARLPTPRTTYHLRSIRRLR